MTPKSPFPTLLALMVLTLGWSATAEAYSFRVNQIPNGSRFSCDLCHIFPGGPRNRFGAQVEANLSGGNANWSAVFDLDADEDGFTNGVELGDPRGLWRTGNPSPPLLSNPNEDFPPPDSGGQPPTATDGALTINEDATGQGTLRGTDPEGRALTYYIEEAPQLGQATVLDMARGTFRFVPPANFSGVVTFMFVTWDGESYSEPGVVVVTVLPVNDAPTMDPVASRTVDEGQAVSMTVTARDVDNPEIEVTVQGLPEGATFDGQTLRWTPDFDQAGQYPLTFIATDPEGAQASRTATITVIDVPQSPTLTALPEDARGDEGQRLSFSAAATDLDDPSLTFTWDFGDGSAPTTGADLTDVSHTFAQDGTFQGSVSVSDGQLQDTATFTVTIANVAPQADAGPDRTVDEGQSVTLPGSLLDPGVLDVHEITWDFGDGSEPARGALVVTHRWRDDGAFTATLEVADEAAQDQDQAAITVRNVAPSVNAGGDQRGVERVALTLQGSFTDPGLDDTHQITWDFGDGQGANGTLTPSHAWTTPGRYAVTLTVTDDDGGIGRDTIEVTIVNPPPEVELGEDLSANEGQPVTFLATAADPGGEPLTLTWDFGDGSEPLEGDGALLTPSHTYNAPGRYTVSLSADDGQSRVTDTLTVTVDNVAPAVTLTMPPRAEEGQPVTLRADAADPGNDPNTLLFTWDFGDGQPLIGAGLHTVEHAFSNDGAFLVSVTVEDGEGGATTARDTLVVDNLPPTDLILTVPEGGDEGQSLTFSATATDPGDDALTFTWDFGDGSPTAQGASVRRGFRDQGDYTVTVTVTDGDGGRATANASIPIANVAPQIDLGQPRAVAVDVETTFTALTFDPGFDEALVVRWDFDGDGTFDQEGPELTEVTHTYDQLGTFTLLAEVEDKDGGLGRRALLVTVLSDPPEVSLEATPAQLNEGSEVVLTATATDPRGQALTLAWDFGDGTTSNDQSPTQRHRYRNDGLVRATVSATDEDGLITSASVALTVLNIAPTVDTNDAAGLEGQPVTLVATATDPGDDALTFTWDFGDGSPTARGDRVSHTYRRNGDFQAEVRVFDGTDTTTALINVTIANAPPSLVAPEAASGQEGTPLRLEVQAADPGDDTLTLCWDFGDGQQTCGADLTSVEHAYRQDGRYLASVVVDDGDASTSATIEVTIDDLPPVLTLPPTLEATQGVPTRFEAQAADPGDDALTLCWDFGDGQQSCGADLTSVEHTYQLEGDFTLTLTATDQDDVEARITAQVTVLNAPPRVALGEDRTAAEGQEITIEADVIDATGDLAELCWDPGDGREPLCGGAELSTFALAWPQDGLYTLTLTATDRDGDSASASIQVRVDNVAPSIEIDPTLTGVEGQPLLFAAAISDPGNDPVEIIWDFGDGTRPLPDLEAPSHTFADDGTFTVTVSADDGQDRAVATITVTILNAPPEATLAQPAPIDEGQSVRLVATASDPGDDALTFTWDFGDGSPAAQGEALTETSHRYRDDGTFTVTLTVDDGDGGTTQATTSVRVDNVAPTVELGPDRQGREGQPVTLSASATDPGDDALIFCWDFGDGQESCGEGLDLTTHAFDDGTFTVTLTVDDGDGGTGRDSVVVVVGNAPPTLEAPASAQGTEGAELLLQVEASDPGGDPVTLTWDFGDGSLPRTLAPGQLEVAHTWADDGLFVATVTARDDAQATTSAQLQVHIANAPPVILSTPPTVVCALDYTYPLQARDPGNDPLTFTLEQGPEGMSIDEAGTVRWTPEVFEGSFTVAVLVRDDGGGEARQGWELSVECDDQDNDGAPDACEEAFGLDPQDPSDGPLDLDGDGLTNTEECQRGTDPLTSNAPGAPSIDRPDGGAVVGEEPLMLVVNNAPDPDGDPLTYTFELSTRPDLSEPLLQREGVVGNEPLGRTSLRVELALEEDRLHHWRARACDLRACGPWSPVATFVHSTSNASPSTPTPVGPEGSADRLTPTLVVLNAQDPELEALTYDFRLAPEDAPEDFVVDVEGVEEGDGRTAHSLTTPLEEDRAYRWQARARDPRGATSDWSAPLWFRANTRNRLPEAATVVSPPDGALVTEAPLTLVAAAPADPDGDEVIWRVRLAAGATFAQEAVLAEAEELRADEQGLLSVTFNALALEEDARYSWQIQGADAEGLGAAVEATFTFSADNAAPGAVTLQQPVDGGVSRTLAPTFVWLPATDPEGEALTYTLEIFSGDNLEAPVEQRAGLTGTRLDGLQLEDRRRYSWRAQATDASGAQGPWSQTARFVVSTANVPPTAPTPVSPVGEIFERGTPIELIWAHSEDFEADALVYDVEVLDDQGQVFLARRVAEATGEQVTSLRLDEGLPAGDYTWRVAAQDGQDASPWSPSAAFQVQGQQPDVATPTPSAPGGDCACAQPARPAPKRLPGLLVVAVAMAAFWRRRRKSR